MAEVRARDRLRRVLLLCVIYLVVIPLWMLLFPGSALLQTALVWSPPFIVMIAYAALRK